MADIGSLVVSLQARTESLERQLNRANGLIRKLQGETRGIGTAARRAESASVRSFTRIGVGVNGLTTRITAASRAVRTFAVAAGAFLAGSFAVRTIAATDELGKFADRIGISVEELQKLRFVASQSGVAVNTMDLALQKFTRRVAEAASGTGEARKVLQELGVQLTDSGGRIRPITDLLGEVADAMGRLPTQADKVRVAFKLFETEGVGLVNVLRLGSTGITELAEKAQRLGLVLNESMVREAEAANDQLDIIQRTINTRLTAAVLNVTPLIVDFGNSFSRVVERFTDGTRAIDGLTSREAALGDFFRGVTQVANQAAQAIGFVVEGLGDIAARITRGILGRPPRPALVGPNPNLPPLPGAQGPARLRINIDESRTGREQKAQAERIKRIQAELEKEQQQAAERSEQRLESFLVRVRQRNQQVQTSFTVTQRIVTTFFEATNSAIANAAVGVAQGTQSISDAIRNMANSIAASLLSSSIQQALGVLQRIAVTSLGAGAGAAAGGGAAGGFAPAVLPLATSGGVARSFAPQVTVVNVADQQQAQRIAALEQAQGRSVTISGLAQQVRTEGNGNPLVQSLRETLRP